MTRPKDENLMESQIVSSEFDISHPILVYLSRNNNSQAQARRFPAMTAPEPEFPVIFGSKWDPLHDECVAPGRRQPQETRSTSDRRLSSPETNLKVGLLPFFLQLLLSHMFLSFMARTSPFSERMMCSPMFSVVAKVFVLAHWCAYFWATGTPKRRLTQRHGVYTNQVDCNHDSKYCFCHSKGALFVKGALQVVQGQCACLSHVKIGW